MEGTHVLAQACALYTPYVATERTWLSGQSEGEQLVWTVVQQSHTQRNVQ